MTSSGSFLTFPGKNWNYISACTTFRKKKKKKKKFRSASFLHAACVSSSETLSLQQT